MIKKWLAAAFMSAILLVGCSNGDNDPGLNNSDVQSENMSTNEQNEQSNDNNQNNNENNNENSVENDPANEEVVDPENDPVDSNEFDSKAEEILENSMAAMSELNSYRMEVKSEQRFIDFDGTEEVSHSTIESEVTLDPLANFQKMTMLDPLTGEEIVSEQYLSEGSIYTVDSMTGGVYVMDLTAELEAELAGLDMSPSDQLEAMKAIMNEIELEEDGDYYVLSVVGLGDALFDVINEMQPGLDELDSDQVQVNSIEYVMYIHKDSYLQEQFTMNIEMETSADLGPELGVQTFKVVNESHSTFTDFNEVQAISVPEHIIDEAIPTNF